MPEGRMVSRSISQSEQLAGVSWQADFLFGRMIPHLDVDGRMTGVPALVKALAVPLRAEIEAEHVPALLKELGDARLLVWYEADGKQAVEFPAFSTHQRGMKPDREAPSRFAPASSPSAKILAGKLPGQPAPSSESVVSQDQLRSRSGPDPDFIRPSEVKSSQVKPDGEHALSKSVLHPGRDHPERERATSKASKPGLPADRSESEIANDRRTAHAEEKRRHTKARAYADAHPEELKKIERQLDRELAGRKPGPVRDEIRRGRLVAELLRRAESQPPPRAPADVLEEPEPAHA